MSQRVTNILGYTTLIAILAAIWILFGEDPSREQGARGEATFAGLSERINEAAVLKITAQDGSVTLAKDANLWTVVERDGFPADAAMVRAFLRGVALSKRRDPKTDNVGRFPQIGLGDLATSIAVLDETDGLLAGFDMGNRTENAAGRSLTYIFQPSDTRSWLVTGIEAAPTDPASWLKAAGFNIKSARIASVRLGGAVLSRALDADVFALSDVPEGMATASGFALNEPASMIARLTFQDVRKTNNPLQAPVQTIVLTTYDGLVLSLDLFTMNDGVWAKGAARYDAAAADEGVAGVLPDAPADIAAEAEELNAWLRGWLFQVPVRAAEILQQKKADFLVPAAE